MKKSVFIIHCSNGNPNIHWYPWLKEKLENKGLNVVVPQFPIGNDQNLDNWLNTMKKYKKYINNSIIL